MTLFGQWVKVWLIVVWNHIFNDGNSKKFLKSFYLLATSFLEIKNIFFLCLLSITYTRANFGAKTVLMKWNVRLKTSYLLLYLVCQLTRFQVLKIFNVWLKDITCRLSGCPFHSRLLAKPDCGMFQVWAKIDESYSSWANNYDFDIHSCAQFKK